MGVSKKSFSAEYLDLFHEPARIIISGQSNSGKSHITKNIIKQYYDKFHRVIVSGADKSTFDLPEEILKDVIFYDELIDPFQEVIFEGCKILYVIDDLYMQALSDKNIALAFTRGRHKGISIILTTQLLFPRGVKFGRDIALNASHFFLTKQRDVSQVLCLGRQIFGKDKAKFLLKAYQKTLSSFQHGHILIDLQCRTPAELQIRSNVFKGEYPFEIVYPI